MQLRRRATRPIAPRTSARMEGRRPRRGQEFAARGVLREGRSDRRATRGRRRQGARGRDRQLDQPAQPRGDRARRRRRRGSRRRVSANASGRSPCRYTLPGATDGVKFVAAQLEDDSRHRRRGGVCARQHERLGDPSPEARRKSVQHRNRWISACSGTNQRSNCSSRNTEQHRHDQPADYGNQTERRSTSGISQSSGAADQRHRALEADFFGRFLIFERVRPAGVRCCGGRRRPVPAARISSSQLGPSTAGRRPARSRGGTRR